MIIAELYWESITIFIGAYSGRLCLTHFFAKSASVIVAVAAGTLFAVLCDSASKNYKPFYIACHRFLKSYLQTDICCCCLPISPSHLDVIVQLIQTGREFTFSAAERTRPTQSDLYLSANGKFSNGICVVLNAVVFTHYIFLFS